MKNTTNEKSLNGILCPKCGSTKSMVVNVRRHADGIYRRRECDECLTRFTTYEFTDEMVKRIKDRAYKMGMEETKENDG